jgi:hypothetical protein
MYLSALDAYDHGRQDDIGPVIPAAIGGVLEHIDQIL